MSSGWGCRWRSPPAPTPKTLPSKRSITRTGSGCLLRWCGGDDRELKAGKPAPDIFLLAAQRLGAKPEHCLVFEDSPAGLEAARRAGMAVVVVPDPDLCREQFDGADERLNSLEEFWPERWGLPGFHQTPVAHG
ncbi:MAG: HAD-IA family hydrolase [Synechococcales cyanobacterium RM1_1_8]|nr:HAD-IA family hydrolase [Synechococcales cyanobacterium RM1_1_8]